MTNSREHHEVIVVGGGPAGIAAAIRLSALQIDCLVLERARGPRVKQCGGAVSPYAVRLYSELGLPEEYFRKKGFATDEGWICGFGVELHGKTSSGQKGYFMERRELDWDFQQLAVSAHAVSLLYGSAVLSICVKDDAVWIDVQNGALVKSYSSRFLVAADGAASPIRTRLSNRKIRPNDRILTSSTILGPEEGNRAMIKFHEDCMPTYSWLFPYRNQRVNVGIGMYASVYNSVGNKPELAAMVARTTGVKCQEKLSNWVINTNPLEKRIFSNRVLLAGDAGGFVDALTGEGIPFALRSGIACADTIADMRRFGSMASRGYSIRMIPAVLRLTISKTLQLLLARFPTLAGLALRLCRRNRAARWLLVKYFSHS